MLTSAALDSLQAVYDPGLKDFLLKVPHHGSANGPEPEEETAKKPVSTLILSALIVPEAKVADGLSIQTITVSWQAIIKYLEKNWDHAHEIPVPVGNSILLATDIESGDAPALCERSVA